MSSSLSETSIPTSTQGVFSTTEDSDDTSSIFYAHIAFRELLAIMGIALHLMVVMGYHLNFQGKFRSFDVLITGLAYFDLFSCCLFFSLDTFYIARAIQQPGPDDFEGGPCICYFLTFVLVACVTKPMGIFMLAFFRYMTISYPMRSFRWFTPKKLMLKLAFLYLKVMVGGAFISYISCHDYKDSEIYYLAYYQDATSILIDACLTGVFIIPTAVLFCLTTRRLKQISSWQKAYDGYAQTKSAFQAYDKSTRIYSFVAFPILAVQCFVLSVSYIQLEFELWHIGKVFKVFNYSSLTVYNILFLLDPIIFACTSENYRKVVDPRKTFKSMKEKLSCKENVDERDDQEKVVPMPVPASPPDLPSSSTGASSNAQLKDLKELPTEYTVFTLSKSVEHDYSSPVGPSRAEWERGAGSLGSTNGSEESLSRTMDWDELDTDKIESYSSVGQANAPRASARNTEKSNNRELEDTQDASSIESNF